MSKTNSSIIISLILLVIAVLFLSCQHTNDKKSSVPTLPENNLPVVNVDFSHDFANEHVGEKIPLILQYEIVAGDGFILNVSDYKIQKPPRFTNLNVTSPNRIEIGLRRNYATIYYYVDWKNDENQFILTSKTLIPLEQQTKPFSGLYSGQEVVVSIGFFGNDEKYTEGKIFYPFWSAGINVK